MSAPTYTTDLQTYNDCSSATGWAEATNMTAANGSGEVDGDLAIYSTVCYTESQRKAGLSSLVYTGTEPTWTSGWAYFIWSKMFAPNSLSTESNGGIRVLIGSTSANYYGHYIGGSDTYEYGGWANYAVDPEFTPRDQTQGSPTGTWNTLGMGWNLPTSAPQKGNCLNVDIMRYGRGESRFTNGDLGNGYATFAGFAAVNDNATTGRWGLIQEIQGGYLYKGFMSLGLTATSVDFRDENTSITIDNTTKVISTFNKIEVHNASSNIEMIRISFVSLGTISPGSFEVIDNATILLDSCSFTDMSTFKFQSQTTTQTVTWSRCDYVVQSGSTIEGCIFSESIGSISLYVDDLDNVSTCNFISDGINHAMELSQAHSGNSYTITDFTYEGYASPSSPPYTGTTGNEVIYNNSAGHVELTVDGGDTPSIRNGVGSTTSLVTSVILSFSVKDESGNPISGATAYIDNDNVSPYLMNELTDVAGEASITWTGGAYALSTWRVRLYGYKPYFLETDVPAIGIKEIPVTLVSDANQTLPLNINFDSSKWQIDYTGRTITNNDSGIGDNLPINTGATWFVEEIGDLFRWMAFESSTGTTIQYTYPVEAITPTQFELINDWNFGDNDNDNKYLKGGSISTSGDTKLWTNIYSLGAQVEGSQLYIMQKDEELEPWWITGQIDLLVKVKDGDIFTQSSDSDGVLIDGALWVYSREFGDFFDHNFIDLSAGGRNPISINTSQDGNNISGEIYITVADSTGFVVDNFVKGDTSSVIGKIEKIGTNDIYLNSVRGGIFVTSETITEYIDRELQIATGQATTNDGTTAYTAIMSDFDGISITFGSVTKDIGDGEGVKPYEVVIDCSGEILSNVYEYLKYVVRYGSSGSTYTIQDDAGQEYRNASGATWSDVKTAPFGSYAGGSFFGARGVWIENMAGSDITNYQLIDSDNIKHSPPIQYSLELTNLVVGSEIRVYSGSTEPKTIEITGVESSTDTFTYVYTYVLDMNTDIVIHSLGYVYIRLYDIVLSSSNLSIPIQQQKDRWYSNP